MPCEPEALMIHTATKEAREESSRMRTELLDSELMFSERQEAPAASFVTQAQIGEPAGRTWSFCI